MAGDDRDEPLSLAPLDPETAIRALLKVDPKSEPLVPSASDPVADQAREDSPKHELEPDS
jgi:hypothetical protein